MRVLRVEGLPPDALAASARFHSHDLPAAEAALAAREDLALVFASADHSHRGWRLAAVQGLAREHAPIRVNAIAGDDEAAIAAALRYLQSAEGVTGQLLPLDSIGAGEVLS
jgi:hypothetical protein